MKVLSVQQPWASLIVAGIKSVENRTWQPKQIPGRILIHASKKTSLRDWSTDIQEAVNMFCFTMRVHSNLVGSVPGKSQTNNSGSDKRELYTIAQALQKPYHDLLFTVHQMIIRFNGWQGCKVDVPFIQLTLLSEHQDAKEVTINQNRNNYDTTNN